MYLTDLTINGFKSFAKKSQLSFPATVTAIVGPNGSGKSNVAEALRFVLGEQSVKSMRGKRGEDLIWGGSEAASRANRASVSITINNEQRVLPLDTDTVTVERVVHRDGQNEYKINQQGVRLKDVHELLAAGNIGPSGHHIISQGEADRILSATPLERRAMIEDALGLKVYQYKKTDAERKVVKTRENIAEVSLLRKELAPHLTYLKRELDKQAEAKAVRTELETAYIEYLKREDVYLAYQYETLKTAVNEQKQLLQKSEAVIADQEKVAADNTVTPDVESTEIKQQRELLHKARSQREEVATKYNQITGRKEALMEQVKALAAEPDEVMVPLSQIAQQAEVMQTAVAEAEKAEDKNALQKVFQAAVRHFSDFVASFQKQPIADKSKEYEEQLLDLMKECERLEAQLSAQSQHENDLQAAYDALLIARDENHHAQQVATKELYEEKARCAELHATVRQYEHELELIERERVSFKDELQEAVALLGRGAARYFDYVVQDTEGGEVSLESIQTEDRSKQRERRRDLERLKIKLETLGDGESESLEQEYNATKTRDDFLAHEIIDLEQSVDTLQTLITDLNQQIDEQFQVGFVKIQQEFQNFFTLMFGGGTAELQLTKVQPTDDDDEADDAAVMRGIELSVRLPNKRIQSLAMLSGGERALTSIALIFAMSQLHPPLFIVLDETDAALDEANSRRYGDLIEALAQRSQLILITHNRETMSRAGILYGVTMGGNGMSKLLSVQLEEAVVNAK